MKKGTVLFAIFCAASFALAACSPAGTTGGDNNGDDNNDINGGHTHSYSEEWAHDETYHWLEPTCTDTTEVKDKATHTYEHGTCSVCDYAHEEHAWSNWAPSKTEHTRRCACGVTESGAHVFDGDSCTLCGYEKEQEPPAWQLVFTREGAGYSVKSTGIVQEREFVIPAEHNGLPVVAIAKEAFKYAWFESIEIPASVTEIREDAFYAAALESVTGGEGLVTIGEDAFRECTLLESFSFGNSLKTIGESAFGNCKKLGPVVIPDSVTTIKEHAFWGCESMMRLTVGTGVKTIESRAFDGCRIRELHIKSLAAWCNISFGSDDANPMYYGGTVYINGEQATELVIPDGVTAIGNYAFYRCGWIERLVIPASVTSIGRNALNFFVDELEIVYGGTLAQWNAIKKGEEWEPYGFTVTCTDGVIENERG